MAARLLKFIAVGVGLGAAIPLLFRLLYSTIDDGSSIPSSAWGVLDYVQLMLWPTPMLLVPAEEPSAANLYFSGVFAVTTLANMTLYGVIAALVCAGIYRAKVILVAPALLIAAIWWAAWQT
jgi:hypothetical protein